MGTQKVMQKVGGGGAVVTGTQQGQCVQVSQAMIGSQPTAQIISPLQVIRLWGAFIFPILKGSFEFIFYGI